MFLVTVALAGLILAAIFIQTPYQRGARQAHRKPGFPSVIRVRTNRQAVSL